MMQVHRAKLTKRMIENQENIENAIMKSTLQSIEEDHHLCLPRILKDIDERSIINMIEITENIRVPIKVGDVQDPAHLNSGNRSIEDAHDLERHRQKEEERGQERLRNTGGDMRTFDF